MKKATVLFVGLYLSLLSPKAHSELNLQVKINQVVGTTNVETVKNISGNFDQDIVIKDDGFKDRIVLNLKKFKDILVNGNKINPVQIDMKIVNEMKKIIGKPQTVTSFYNQSANFTTPNFNVSLNFQEI